MEDKYLVCKDCGNEFCFQHLNKHLCRKGFENEPGRCPSCRRARKQQRNSFGNSRSREERQMFSTVCAACGQRLQYHSNLLETDRYIAEIVSRPDGLTAIDK